MDLKHLFTLKWKHLHLEDMLIVSIGKTKQLFLASTSTSDLFLIRLSILNTQAYLHKHTDRSKS